jgi:hypothetical protein
MSPKWWAELAHSSPTVGWPTPKPKAHCLQITLGAPKKNYPCTRFVFADLLGTAAAQKKRFLQKLYFLQKFELRNTAVVQYSDRTSDLVLNIALQYATG